LDVGSGPDQRYQEHPHSCLVRCKTALMRPYGGVDSETKRAMPAKWASGVCGACAVPWPWADISRDDFLPGLEEGGGVLERAGCFTNTADFHCAAHGAMGVLGVRMCWNTSGSMLALTCPPSSKILGLPKVVGPAAFFFAGSSPDKRYDK